MEQSATEMPDKNTHDSLFNSINFPLTFAILVLLFAFPLSLMTAGFKSLWWSGGQPAVYQQEKADICGKPCSKDSDCGLGFLCGTPCPPGEMCAQYLFCYNPDCPYENDCICQEENQFDESLAREGEMCGGIRGIICQERLECIYENGSKHAPYPDASGICQLIYDKHDYNKDGVIGLGDLLHMLVNWGSVGGVREFLWMLSNWGETA